MLGMVVSYILFVVSQTLATIAAVCIGWAFGNRAAWRVALVGMAAYGVLAQLLILLLGIAGFLTAAAATIVTSGVAIVALVQARRVPPDVLRARNEDLQLCQGEDARLWPAALMLLSGLLGLQLATSAFSATVLQWDDLSYHAAVVAQWMQDKEFSIVPSTYQAYYPFGAELLALWFMLPFHSDSFASLAGFYWLLLGAVSIFSIVLDSEGSRTTAALIAVAFLSSPRVLGLAQTFSANDLAGAVLITAAVAVSLAPDTITPRERRSNAILSGLLVGLAIGCKITFTIPGAAILAWWLVRCSLLERDRQTASTVALFAAPAIISGGYWYIRNWVAAGNPVFPAAMGPFSGPFDAASQARTTAWHWLSTTRIPRAQWRNFLDWPLFTGLMAFAGYTNVIVKTFRNTTGKISFGGVDFLLLAIGVLSIAFYPFLPFSGTINRPYADVELSPRYVAVAIILGLVLYRHLLSATGQWRYVWLTLLLLACGSGLSAWSVKEMLLFLTFALVGAWTFQVLVSTQTSWRVACVALMALLFVVLGLDHPRKQRATSSLLYQAFGPDRPIGEAWQELEKLPPCSRIAFFMSEPTEYTQYYPLFGRTMQFQPAYVDGAGVARRTLHNQDRTANTGWWGEWQQSKDGAVRVAPNVSADQLVENLKAARVDYVLTSRWSLGQWPPQHFLLRQSGSAIALYDDGYSVIWQLPSTAARGAGSGAM
jgi:hypothetical protein